VKELWRAPIVGWKNVPVTGWKKASGAEDDSGRRGLTTFIGGGFTMATTVTWSDDGRATVLVGASGDGVDRHNDKV
jgi:hypothetical protein